MMAAAEGEMAAAAGIGLGPSSGGGKTKTKGLDCPICFEAYGSSCHMPMVLSCGHTLCEDCVVKNRRGGDKVSRSSQAIDLSSQPSHHPSSASGTTRRLGAAE